MIRVSDYIAKTLANYGIKHVFMVTGGGAMHLNDAFGREKRLKCVYFHHEQSCSIAADSNFRLTNQLSAINVATGPGGTNAITGVYGAPSLRQKTQGRLSPGCGKTYSIQTTCHFGKLRNSNWQSPSRIHSIIHSISRNT